MEDECPLQQTRTLNQITLLRTLVDRPINTICPCRTLQVEERIAAIWAQFRSEGGGAVVTEEVSRANTCATRLPLGAICQGCVLVRAVTEVRSVVWRLHLDCKAGSGELQTPCLQHCGLHGRVTVFGIKHQPIMPTLSHRHACVECVHQLQEASLHTHLLALTTLRLALARWLVFSGVVH
jgi:hypothetical protein